MDRTEFIQTYEGYFSCKFPVEFDAEHNPKNPIEGRLWMDFIDGCELNPERICAKAADLRGRSRVRPSLADMKHAAAIVRSELPTYQHRIDCALCNGTAWVTVLVHYDPNQPWRKTAKIGHYPPEGYVLAIVAIPCCCSAGLAYIRANDGHELTSRIGNQWRVNFNAESKLNGWGSLVQYMWALIADSWAKVREKESVPA